MTRIRDHTSKNALAMACFLRKLFAKARGVFTLHVTSNCDVSKELPVMEEASILLSAHHKTPDSTATYLDNSGTLEVHVSRDPVNKECHMVGRWDPIYMAKFPFFGKLKVPETSSGPFRVVC
jgi:hypothetical protein